MIEVFNKEEIIDFLRNEDELSNLNMICAIENIDRGIYGRDQDRLRIYVDDEENPNGVLVREHDYWYYIYHKNDIFLEKAKRYFDNLGEYGVDACDKYVYDYMIKDRNLEWDEHCLLYYHNEVSEKSSIDLESLTLDDAEIVNSFYTYKDEESIHFIRDNILNRPTSVYRVNGQPVAWVMVHRDGSTGIMYVKEEYRKRGLAYDLSLDLIDKLKSDNKIPFIHININNYASQALASKVGFKKLKSVYWYGIKDLKT